MAVSRDGHVHGGYRLKFIHSHHCHFPTSFVDGKSDFCNLNSMLRYLQTNQVDALRAADVPAASINGTTTQSEKQRILKDLATGHPLTRLLYITPESCALDYIRRHLTIVHEQQELARIAVDEAHCNENMNYFLCKCL
jgi:hypothetical protein